MSNSIFHPANSRGNADHGWLRSKHTFSFGAYHDPDRMQFGALRVLNDDFVAAGMGFGKHPHQNMEIISIPLEGDLEHQDSLGNTTVIRNGDVQVMSAGTGITHSEFNRNTDKPVQFLQIWIFPNKKDVKPRYGQISLNPADRHNRLQQIISPYENEQDTWIHQDAWFYLGKFDLNFSLTYSFNKKTNGIYAFILQGDLLIDGKILNSRDGLGIWNTEQVQIKALSQDAELLLIEVPMDK